MTRPIRNPSYREFLEWQSAARGGIRIVTVAPELPGALSFIERITADGHHLPTAALRTMAQTKGVERVVPVSDLSPMAGLEPRTYEWSRIRGTVGESGVIEVHDSPYFAGAWRSLLENLSVFAAATDTTRLATIRPMHLIGLESWYRTRMEHGTMTVLRWDERRRTIRVIFSSSEGTIIRHDGDLLTPA